MSFFENEIEIKAKRSHKIKRVKKKKDVVREVIPALEIV